MTEKYTLKDAAEYLGINQSEVEDLVAEGEISFEIMDDEYYISKENLFKVRVSRSRKTPPKNPPPFRILDDYEYMEYLEDYITLRSNEVIRKMEKSAYDNRVEREKVRRFLAGKLDNIGNNLKSFTEGELTQKAQEKLEEVIASAVGKAVGGKSAGTGEGLQEKDILQITSSIEKLIEEKLGERSLVVQKLASIENRMGNADDRFLRLLTEIKQNVSSEDFTRRMEAFLNYMMESIEQKMSLLSNDKSDISALMAKLKDIKGDGGNLDVTAFLTLFQELSEGQKKIKKAIIDLNSNLQKTITGRLDEIKRLNETTPEMLVELQRVLPEIKDNFLARTRDFIEFGRIVNSIQQNFTLEGQQDFIKKLEEIHNGMQKADQGNILSKMDHLFKENKRALEQVFVTLSGRSQKALTERMDKLQINQQSIDFINEHIRIIENSFTDLSRLVEERYQQIDRAVNKIKFPVGGGLKSDEGGRVTMDTSELESRLVKIQELMDKYQDKFDMPGLLNTLKEILDGHMDTMKRSQDSFQKIIVNLNVNNQKSITDKLEQLDRLNELIAVRDNVEELNEQMQTFEAIVADINQLVDERLQVLGEIHNSLGNLSAGGTGAMVGDSGTVVQKIQELRSIVEMMQDRFSVESLLAHTKRIIEEESNSIRQNQDSLHKIMLNLTMTGHKGIFERLENLGAEAGTLRNLKDQMDSLRDMIPQISALLEAKLQTGEGLKNQIDKLDSSVSNQEILRHIQKIIENETKSLRQNMDSSQKVVMNLGVNNHKLLMEKLNAVGISNRSIEDIITRNRELLAEIIGEMAPGHKIAGTLENIELIMGNIRDNVNTEMLLEKFLDYLNYRTGELKKNQDASTEILNNYYRQYQKQVLEQVDKLQSVISEIKFAVNPDNLTSSIGGIIVHGNESLKENQEALIGLEIKNHRELIEQLKQIQSLKGAVSSAGAGGDILPILESLMENQVTNFKRDLDGAHKVLVKLNVDLQKQLLQKIQEIIASQTKSMEVKIDSESLMNAIDYLLEDKLSDIKDNQDALLSVNLNTQKMLKEKLDAVKGKAVGESSISDELNSLLPLMENIINNKMKEVLESHREAQKALMNLNSESHKKIVEKLENISFSVQSAGGNGSVDPSSLLPALRQVMGETCNYIGTLKSDLQAIQQNLRLQDPEFLGKKFEDIRNFLTSGPLVESLPRIENSLRQSIGEHRESVRVINERIEFIYEALKAIYEQRGEGATGSGLGQVQELFSSKMEETRQLEQQLIQSFKDMQNLLSKGGFNGGGTDTEGYMNEILQNIEETRLEQERLSSRVERLQLLISSIPAIKSEEKAEQMPPPVDDQITDQLKKENAKLKQLAENLRRENITLHGQLKSSRTGIGGVDSKKMDQLQSVMNEKDRLLEECYREKVELREGLEKEKRDKYEIIQKYETEKKELIDSLALERIQREKDRAELELLRAESRKKKWW